MYFKLIGREDALNLFRRNLCIDYLDSAIRCDKILHTDYTFPTGDIIEAGVIGSLKKNTNHMGLVN